jgi:hypothetical protein
VASADDILNEYKQAVIANSEDDMAETIAKMDDYLANPAVFATLLSSLEHQPHSDICRIEALKVLEVADVKPSQRQQIASSLLRLFDDDDDNDVLNYAAMAAVKFMDFDQVSDKIQSLLMSPTTDETLRWNCFAAVKRSGPSKANVAAMLSLRGDPIFGQSATRVLNEWPKVV